jgi:glycosyltransferase involved in cell wall biosynthesis
MPRLCIVVPGCLDSRTGGYEYDRRMAVELRSLGWLVDVRTLDGSFPRPTTAAVSHAARVLAQIPDGSAVLMDGLALGAMPALVEAQAGRLRIVALVHLPLAAETGLEPAVAAGLETSERRALAAAALVVVTGDSVVRTMREYGVPRGRIAVVEPGTDPAPLARGSDGPALELLSVAALTPRKGHEILIRALTRARRNTWHLTCAGSLDRDARTVDRIRSLARKEGLEDRIALVGELGPEALAACYDRSDVFVLASLHETYGMAVAEALARGLPVVSTTAGAIPKLVGVDRPGEPGGLLAPPGDVEAFRSALVQVLDDAALRARLKDGARQARQELPTWQAAAAAMNAVLAQVAAA